MMWMLYSWLTISSAGLYGQNTEGYLKLGAKGKGVWLQKSRDFTCQTDNLAHIR